MFSAIKLRKHSVGKLDLCNLLITKFANTNYKSLLLGNIVYIVHLSSECLRREKLLSKLLIIIIT
jgi:hypothetical protein